METTAWASLLKTETDNNTLYRIRFNRLTSKLLDGVEWAYINKTDKYLVITPAADPGFKSPNMVHIVHKSDGRYIIAEMCMNRIVLHERIISGSFFGRSMRYKVKRDKTGRIYIELAGVVQ